MSVLAATVFLAVATPAAYPCYQMSQVEIMPGATVLVQSHYNVAPGKDGQVRIWPGRPDIYRVSLLWPDFRKSKGLSLGLVWPEAKSPQASLSQAPKWWVETGRLSRNPGKYLTLDAQGNRRSWSARIPLGYEHPIIQGPQPFGFGAASIELHNSDRSIEAVKELTMPDWVLFRQNLKNAQVQLATERKSHRSKCLHPPVVPAPEVQ